MMDRSANDDGKWKLERRRELRRRATRAERLLWSALRDRRLGGLKFRRQHSIGSFIVDFYCAERALVVELDGDYHDYVQDKDLERQRYLVSEGCDVLRFTNDDVLQDLEAVVTGLANYLGIELPQ